LGLRLDTYTAHVVLDVTHGILGRFLIPERQWGESVYISEIHDGRWAGFRDRWPEEILATRSA
jgi:hypothetical protein